MGTLRALVEEDLVDTLEGEFGMPVILLAPDGTKYSTSANDPLGKTPLEGMVFFDQARVSLTGEVLIVQNPQVTLRRSSLARIPAMNENWGVFIPSGPSDPVASTFWTIDWTRAPEGGLSIGFIRFYLQRAVQS